MRVVLSEVAIARLEAIEDFVSETNPAAAKRLIERLHRRMRSLATLPRRGRIVPELPGGKYREVFEGTFRIVYTVGSDRVEIATVFDASRGLRAEELQ